VTVADPIDRHAAAGGASGQPPGAPPTPPGSVPGASPAPGGVVEIACAHSQARIDRETAQALGAAEPAGTCGLRVTAGRLALLDLIGSPLADGNPEAATPLDVWRAVYVLAVGPAAVAPVARAIRHREALAQAREIAQASPDAFDRWCVWLQAAADAWTEFDAAALAFADGAGFATHAQGLALLSAMLSDACGPFEMAPRALDGTEKKTAAAPGSAASGLPTSTPPPPAPPQG